MSNISDGRSPDLSFENMPSFSRRRLLGGLAASAAVATPLAVGALPAAAADTDIAEHPWVVAQRLADDLAGALDRINGGAWRAEILPASAHRYAVGFFRRDESQEASIIRRLETISRDLVGLDDGQWIFSVCAALGGEPIVQAEPYVGAGLQELENLIDAHEQAFAELVDACEADDVVGDMTEAEAAEYERACSAETAAMQALCLFRCRSTPEWITKGTYLARFVDEVATHRDHVDALIASMRPGHGSRGGLI